MNINLEVQCKVTVGFQVEQKA